MSNTCSRRHQLVSHLFHSGLKGHCRALKPFTPLHSDPASHFLPTLPEIKLYPLNILLCKLLNLSPSSVTLPALLYSLSPLPEFKLFPVNLKLCQLLKPSPYIVIRPALNHFLSTLQVIELFPVNLKPCQPLASYPCQNVMPSVPSLIPCYSLKLFPLTSDSSFTLPATHSHPSHVNLPTILTLF